MKKLFAFLLATLMIFSFAACDVAELPEEPIAPETTDPITEPGEPTIAEPKDRLAKIKEAGVLTVCTEPYFAPLEFIDPSKPGDEQYVGIDIEFAKYIADKIGVRLQIVPLEFGAVLAGIAEGKYDLAISALSWSKTRAETMNLSIGYYTSDENDEFGFFCRAEDVEKYTDLESLKDAVVITQSGSVQEGYYDEYVKECKEFKRTSAMTDSYLAVSEGKADVCICSIAAARLWAEANGNTTGVTAYRFPFDESKGGTRVAACLEDTETLMELVNRCIEELTAENKFKEWNETYQEYAKSLGISF